LDCDGLMRIDAESARKATGTARNRSRFANVRDHCTTETNFAPCLRWCDIMPRQRRFSHRGV
jgi:hypothetical protein